MPVLARSNKALVDISRLSYLILLRYALYIVFEYVRPLILVCVLVGELNAPLAWS